MAGLTVTEKQHWKDRIARRIDKKIEAIWNEEPSLEERIEREATRRAEQSLGLAEVRRELDAIDTQKEEIEKRERRLYREALAAVQKKTVDDVELSGGDYWGWSGALPSEVRDAIGRRKAVIEDELLGENERGRRILALRREKDNLLDTVWLATSPAQIKELWAKVVALLGDEQTPLERDALAIAPAEEP